jgi:hypothetical protein
MKNRKKINLDANGITSTSQTAASQPSASHNSAGEKATQIALALRHWLSKNPGIGTIKRLSATSGVAYSTLKKIAAGQHPPAVGTLRRLVEQGGVECLREWLPSDSESKDGMRLQEAKARPGTPEEYRSENEERVRRIVGTFYSLKDQLEFLKGENEQGRELFRKQMSRRDAAYMVALLQALFSEDEFQKWIFFSEYKSGGIRR